MNGWRALEWACTATQVVGVFALSTRAAPPPVAFAIMGLGSVGWAALAGVAREWPLLTLNLMFTLSNGVGLARWWA